MPRPWVTLLVAGVALLTTPAHGNSTNLTRSVSASRQFVCYAHDPLIPAALGYVAEQVKRQWLRELGFRDEWRDAIVLVMVDADPARPPAENPARLIAPTALGWKYQITWFTPPPPDSSRVLPPLVEMLCAEWIQRSVPPLAGRPATPVKLPPWVVLGLTHRIQQRDEIAWQRARRVREEGVAPSAVLLLSARDIPSGEVERDLFAIHAGLMWEALRALPGGAAKLQQFLLRLPAPQDATDVFWEVFRDEFSAPAALERWWAVQFAARTGMQPAQNLTPRETEQRLQRILRTRLWVPDDEASTEREVELSLAELSPYMRDRWLQSVIQDKRSRLAALHEVTLPAYREIIAGYDEALRWLAEGHRVRFRRVLTRTERQHAALTQTHRAVEEYLDHIEWQRTPADYAGGLQGALGVLEELDRLQRQRRNPISEYLDRWDR